jgi:NAD(P)H-flavin reductase
VREYTPISSASEWEQGRLSLLVKTYGDGRVSKKFAMLRAGAASVASF